MRRTWFKEWGWIYLPVSWQGFILTIVAALFCIQVFIFADRRSHSVSDTLYGVFPYWVPTIGIWLWVASKTSSGSKPETKDSNPPG